MTQMSIPEVTEFAFVKFPDTRPVDVYEQHRTYMGVFAGIGAAISKNKMMLRAYPNHGRLLRIMKIVSGHIPHDHTDRWRVV